MAFVPEFVHKLLVSVRLLKQYKTESTLNKTRPLNAVPLSINVASIRFPVAGVIAAGSPVQANNVELLVPVSVGMFTVTVLPTRVYVAVTEGDPERSDDVRVNEPSW